MLRCAKVLSFLVILLFGAGSFAYAKKADFQYWSSESIGWNISKKWKLSLSEEHYFRNDAEDFYYQHTEIGATYSGLVKWMDVGLNFRHVRSKGNSGWKREEQPSFNAYLKFKLKDYSISDRNRFEYRFKQDAQDYWRYRNLLTIKLPLKWTRYEIQPMLSDEIFVDLDKKEFNENRLMPGFSFKINKNLNAEIVYMWRRVKSSDTWSANHAVWTRLKLEF